jgi:hypothetical protein
VFQVEVTDRQGVTTSIQKRTREGVIQDNRNRAWKIVQQRSVPYGKGGGGGGGKYIMGRTVMATKMKTN